MNKIALVSDIHGNVPALEAVLDDIHRRKISRILNLGDSLYGPLWPAETFRLIMDNEILSIAGNEDRILHNFDERHASNPAIGLVRKQLNHDAMEWLISLPFDMLIEEELYACHGSPRADTEYLIEETRPEQVLIRSVAALERMLAAVRQKIVLCGHSHVPGMVSAGEKTIINPGSVGLPAYDDDHPVFHKMQNYSNHARYAILEYGEQGLRLEQIAIAYDFESAARQAEKNNRPDWARWLRSGRA